MGKCLQVAFSFRNFCFYFRAEDHVCLKFGLIVSKQTGWHTKNTTSFCKDCSTYVLRPPWLQQSTAEECVVFVCRFGSGGNTGAASEKMLETSHVSNGVNASWLRDGPQPTFLVPLLCWQGISREIRGKAKPRKKGGVEGMCFQDLVLFLFMLIWFDW